MTTVLRPLCHPAALVDLPSVHTDAPAWSQAQASSAACWAIDAGAPDGVALIAATLAGNADASGLIGPCPPRIVSRLTELSIPECRDGLRWLRRHRAITYARRPGLPPSVIVDQELLGEPGGSPAASPRPRIARPQRPAASIPAISQLKDRQ
jgi:hypothetical protein